MLRLEPLESRDCPSFLGSRNGWVLMPDDNDFVPFPDFRADHATAGDQFTVVVGAASGGGPRVQVRDEGKVTADFFAYEETFRGGVNVAYDRGVVVTSAAHGGGPVVAVFDIQGKELARFFAYDADFRGGVSVAIRNGTIYTVPGPGGGPVVRSFDLHGTPLGEDFFGDDADRRDGWDLILGDVTHDRLADVVLAARSGRISINDGATGFRAAFTLPSDYTRAGYEGESLTVGNESNYLRGRALWTSFPSMTEFESSDAAAGNPNPPPTRGTRPGVYRPVAISGGTPPEFDNLTTFGRIDVSGSVGTSAVGTGSSYVPLLDATGSQYVVTASHVARRSPFAGPNELGSLVAPGRLDGTPSPAGTPASVSRIVSGTPYRVDAAAFRPAAGVVLSDDVAFGNESVRIDGVADSVEPGDVLIAVGRGRFIGAGTVDSYQTDAVSIRWPSGDAPLITGQIIGIRGAVPLAVPGFSGGVALRIVWTPEGIRRELVGMVVAGNETVVFITPHRSIETALGLTFHG